MTLSTSLTISATQVSDNAAPSTVIGSVSAPPGYTVELIYDSDGRFAMSGQDLIVGPTTLLTPGTCGPGGSHTWPGPVLRAVKPGAACSDLVLRPIITVNAVRSPAEIAGLAAAWVSESGITVNGSNQVTGWAGAYGTSYSLVQTAGTACPSVLPDYANGLPGIKFNGAQSQFMNISPALPLSDGTIVAIYQPLDTSANKAILGSSTRFLWQTSATSVSLNMGSTVAAAPAAAATMSTARINALIVTHDGTTGAYAARVDGVPATGGGNAGVSVASFTRVGKHKTGSFGNYVMTGLLIYNRVLTADEIAVIEAWAMSRRTTEWFCAADGVSGNNGFSAATPKNSALTFISGSTLRAWDKVRSKGGDVMVGTLSGMASYFATAAKPVRAMTYGTGKPKWRGVAQSALTYTGSYPTQSVALARNTDIGIIWWYRDGIGSPPVAVMNRALTADRSFQYTGLATLDIRLEAGRNANSEILYIPLDTSDQQLFGISKNYFELHGHDVRHYAGQMWSPQGTKTVLRDCFLGFSIDDGHSPGGSAHDCSFNEITMTGTGLSITRGPGDGISVHGGAGHTLRYNYIHDCFGPGIRNEEGSGVIMEGNNVENCAAPLRIIKNVAFPGPATVLYRGNRIQRGATALQRDGLLLDSGLPADIAVTAADNLFVGEGVLDGVAIRNNGLGTVTASGNVQTGFAGLGG